MKFLTVIGIMALTVSANAAAISNNMSCAEAQAHYDRHGRIYTQTGSGDVVPIYGDKSCSYGQDKDPVFVRTKDTSMCKVAFRCSNNSRN
ncbi:MAG: hypothetical protein KF767_12795 [Bdellovibrionaceae bacterium]|nr:hypothetical protein [Pseudobdellovibrionaceae bacterium]